jgi:mercuric ion transport protein
MRTKFTLGTAIAAGFAATLCCIAPLLLFMLGISGAWIANLTAMEPYKPYLLALAIVCVAYGVWKVYRKSPAVDCKAGTYCATPIADKINKIMLCLAIGLILLVIIYPYIAPAILEKL